jgi:putative endonuclease
MNDIHSLGKEGETYACGILVKRGYTIIERNVSLRIGEIDIIARAPDKTLVFVEVKTINGFSSEGFHPEDHMTAKKIKNFRASASLYANARKDRVKNDAGFRLDLIALSKVGNDFVVRHYENVC